MKDEMIGLANVIVRRYNIITTDHWVYEVLEPTAGITGEHTSITRIDGEWYGSMATRRIPAFIDAMKGEVRYRNYDLWREALLEQCYDLIVQAFPEAAKGRCSDGQISLTIEGTGWHRTKEQAAR